MKDKIKEKFNGVKHKWIYFHTDTREFQLILDKITVEIHNKNITSKNAIKLIKSFKFHEKAFLKFIKTSGRKNFTCVCQVIDINNNKINIELSPESVLYANMLTGTPKSMKLYKTNEKNRGVWKKPDDGFKDPIQYPKAEDELTELGYAMYKDWTEEVAASGLNSIDYYRKLCGTLKYYKKVR